MAAVVVVVSASSLGRAVALVDFYGMSTWACVMGASIVGVLFRVLRAASNFDGLLVGIEFVSAEVPVVW